MTARSPSEARRFDRTLAFLEGSVPRGSRLLDIGTPNALGTFLEDNGYSIVNAHGGDLDVHPELVSGEGYAAATAFEILEHLVNPMGVLKALKTPRLVASVPLRLWFAPAYRNESDPWDRHFHEFEDWQFDWLLEASGWEIVRREKWTSRASGLGIRPFLRTITPRYYAVEAVRKT